MNTSVYNAQCKTFKIARELTGLHYDATPRGMLVKPPYCLRILKPYRTSEMQAFRDQVARLAWQSRH